MFTNKKVVQNCLRTNGRTKMWKKQRANLDTHKIQKVRWCSCCCLSWQIFFGFLSFGPIVSCIVFSYTIGACTYFDLSCWRCCWLLFDSLKIRLLAATNLFGVVTLSLSFVFSRSLSCVVYRYFVVDCCMWVVVVVAFAVPLLIVVCHCQVNLLWRAADGPHTVNFDSYLFRVVLD